MGAILWALGNMGYGVAYRVLDSQWFGLAQRRKRVFIVGCLGDGRRAAEVLFEPACLPWHSAPGRKKQSSAAGTIDAGAGVRRGAGINPGTITHTLKAEGHDASEDGTGRGVPLVAASLRSRQSSPGVSAPGRGGEDDQNLVVSAYRTSPNCGAWDTGDRVHALTTGTDPSSHILAFAQNQRDELRDLKGIAGSLAAEPGMKQQTYVAYAIQERAVSENSTNGPQGKGWQDDLAFTLEARHHQQSVAMNGVRRLTPRECERLQGFPDDWTRWGKDGEEISDSARYRALGNAVSVPVIEWIGRRIIEANKPGRSVVVERE